MLQHHFSKDVYNNGSSEQQEPSQIQCGSDLAPTKSTAQPRHSSSCVKSQYEGNVFQQV